jgi:hypothetical protein
MKFTKEHRAKLYYIPDNKDIKVGCKIVRWRKLHMDNHLSVRKYTKLKESGLLHFIEFNSMELQLIQSINNVYKIWVETGKIPIHRENKDVARIGKYKAFHEVLHTKIIEYTHSLGMPFLWETKDKVVVAHNKLSLFIDYYKKLGRYPYIRSQDKIGKRWGVYFSCLKYKYKYKDKQSGIFLDDWMIKECAKNNISLETLDIRARSYDTLLEFISYYKKLGRYPSQHSEYKIEKYWGCYISNLKQAYRSEKSSRVYLDDWMIKELSNTGINLNDNGILIRSINIIDNIIINFPDIKSFMDNLYKSARYCLLYDRIRKKSTTNYKELYPYANKVLSDHYHIKDFLSYSYVELNALYNSGKLKSKENTNVKSKRETKIKGQRKSA